MALFNIILEVLKKSLLAFLLRTNKPFPYLHTDLLYKHFLTEGKSPACWNNDYLMVGEAMW